MTNLRKNLVVYVLLALAWPLMLAWLISDHDRVKTLAREKLRDRAPDISNTIALMSRMAWGRVIRKSRLEESLQELTEFDRDLIAIALLNAQGEVVVEAGPPLWRDIDNLTHEATFWDKDKVTVVNPVLFGAITDDRGTTGPMAIVLPSREEEGRNDEDRPSPPEARRDGENRDGHREEDNRDARPERRGRRERAMPFGRPPWMDEAEYDAMLRKQGLHGFVLVLSTQAMQEEIDRDFWLRVMSGAIGLLAVGGLALAWRSMERTTGLQMRLLRAHEMTSHLQEMNIAAAGLAHETRNPLNIVRGLAQMISQREEVSPEIRNRSHQITEEVDRVTVRLNEFINYSKPPEPRPAPTDALAVARDVARALESDYADKGISLDISGPLLTVSADESLLRQVLFNLLLNSIQAVGQSGRIAISIAPAPHGEAILSVADNGPGVPADIRDEIFRPYYTTNEHGTGLGLAVVRQIVLAHRWEIDYVQNEPGGAIFRISGMKIL